MTLTEEKRILIPPPSMLLSVGDIVGKGVRCARHGWRVLADLMLPAAILQSLSITAATWALSRAITHSRTHDSDSIPITVGLVAASVVIGLTAAYQFALRTVAIKRMSLIERTTAESALQYARSKRWSALRLYFLSVATSFILLAFFAGGVFGVLALKLWVPLSITISILLFLLAAAVHIALYLYWANALSVLAAEELPIPALLNRSWHLTESAPWRGCGYVLLIIATLWIIGTILNAPIAVFYLVDFLLKTHTITSHEIPMWLRIFDLCFITLKIVILTPCTVICNALFYNDVRMRLDGWDLIKGIEFQRQLDNPTN